MPISPVTLEILNEELQYNSQDNPLVLNLDEDYDVTIKTQTNNNTGDIRISVGGEQAGGRVYAIPDPDRRVSYGTANYSQVITLKPRDSVTNEGEVGRLLVRAVAHFEETSGRTSDKVEIYFVVNDEVIISKNDLQQGSVVNLNDDPPDDISNGIDINSENGNLIIGSKIEINARDVIVKYENQEGSAGFTMNLEDVVKDIYAKIEQLYKKSDKIDMNEPIGISKDNRSGGFFG